MITKKEILLREVVENAPFAVAMFDENMCYMEASQRWLRDFGLSPDIIGKCHYVVFPDIPDHWKAIHRRCLAGSTEQHDGDRFARQDGSIYWIRWKVCPWRDATGAIAGILIYSEDITQKKQDEEALRTSEELFRRAQRVARVGTFEWNIQTGVNTWTPDLERMYGLPIGSFGRTQSAWEDMVHPEDRDHAVQRVEEAFKTGAPTEGEWRVVWPDGSTHWLAGRFQVFTDGAGKPLRLTGVNIDITERKFAEAERARLLNEIRDLSSSQQALFLRIGEILEAALDANEMAKRVAEATVPFLGDLCGVFIAHDDVTRVQLVHGAPDMVPVIEALKKYRYPVPKQSMHWQCFERREAIVAAELPASHYEKLAVDAEQLRLLKALAPKSGVYVPLIAHGRCHGAFSVHSRDPKRTYTSEDLQVVEEVARRLALAIDSAFLHERVRLEAAITAHLAEGVFLIRAADGVIEYANTKFEKMFGYEPGELIGKHVSVVNAPGDGDLSPQQIAETIGNELRRTQLWHGEVENIKKDGRRFWCDASVSTFQHPQFGAVWIAIHTDITDRKTLEQERDRTFKEREILLKEVHHRVKNNLQVISSLFYLQSQRTAQEPIRRLLEESRSRIRSIALIHEKLCQSEHLALIDFGDYLNSLTAGLISALGVQAPQVKVHIQAENVFLDIERAIPCALIVNELVSNALKHAFPDGRNGEIRISVSLADSNLLQLEVSDTGIGFPVGLDFMAATTLGMQLIVSLAKQLRGTTELSREGGTSFRIRFRLSFDS